jgi:hypothetical protein
VNVGSAETRPLGTGLPAVEVVSAWRRGRSSVSVGKPRTRPEMNQVVAKAPSWRSKQVSGGMSWICMDAISLTRCCFASRANLPNRADQAVNGEPVAFSGARRVRRGGWGNTPVERREGAPCPYSTRGLGVMAPCYPTGTGRFSGSRVWERRIIQYGQTRI